MGNQSQRTSAGIKAILPRLLTFSVSVGLAPPVIHAQAGDSTLVIREVTVVDPVEGLQADMTVTVRGGLIESVGPTSGATLSEVAVLFDGTGLFLIPGLIDAHVHLGQGTTQSARELLGFLLRGGVTSVRDMAGDTRVTGGLAYAIRTHELSGPSVYYSALMAGPQFMEDPRAQRASGEYEVGTAPWIQAVGADSDFVKAVAAARGTGATGIKLYADLGPEVVGNIVAEAHRQGLKVGGHATVFPAKPGEMVAAGIDGLSHAPYLVWEGSPAHADFTQRASGDFSHIAPDGPEVTALLERMAASGTVLDPTLWVFRRSRERPDQDQDQDQDLAVAREAWGFAVTRLAQTMGVTIDAGTDGAGDPEADELPNLHEELELLVEAGLTPMEALVAGTLGGAVAIGIEETHGRIAPGRVADFVILEADPTVAIRATREIQAVFKGGRAVER